MNSLKKQCNFNYQCSGASPQYHKVLSLLKAKDEISSAFIPESVRKTGVFHTSLLIPKIQTFLLIVSSMTRTGKNKFS